MKHVRRFMPFLLLAVAAAAAGAPAKDAGKGETGKKIYRTVDESGNVVFSDQPAEGAAEVELQESNSLPGDAVNAEYDLRFGRDNDEETAPAFKRYRSLAITSPANEEAVRANNGDITISVNVEPVPQQAHRIEFLMDGQVVQEVQGPTTIAMENVDRGAHQAQLKVIDRATGRTLQQGPSSTFYVLRASRLN